MFLDLSVTDLIPLPSLPLSSNWSVGGADASCDSVVTTPQHSLRDANNPAGGDLAEFLSKAMGTAVDWVHCSGVAARACGLVSLEPTKIAEILKDRPSWFRDCRNLEVFTMFPAGNGRTIELVYTQVCERSLSGSGAGPSAAAATQFVRAEVLPSGYLIRPCEGGGSIIHIVYCIIGLLYLRSLSLRSAYCIKLIETTFRFTLC
ncbi:hypothetical protein REPUB_Repub13aG0162800 [Reevesia pubescens]